MLKQEEFDAFVIILGDVTILSLLQINNLTKFLLSLRSKRKV